MQLKVISSGSSGNSYLLTCGCETLILDVGRPFKEVKIALGFNIRQIVGTVVTHEHG